MCESFGFGPLWQSYRLPDWWLYACQINAYTKVIWKNKQIDNTNISHLGYPYYSIQYFEHHRIIQYPLNSHVLYNDTISINWYLLLILIHHSPLYHNLIINTFYSVSSSICHYIMPAAYNTQIKSVIGAVNPHSYFEDIIHYTNYLLKYVMLWCQWMYTMFVNRDATSFAFS